MLTFRAAKACVCKISSYGREQVLVPAFCFSMKSASLDGLGGFCEGMLLKVFYTLCCLCFARDLVGFWHGLAASVQEIDKIAMFQPSCLEV